MTGHLYHRLLTRLLGFKTCNGQRRGVALSASLMMAMSSVSGTAIAATPAVFDPATCTITQPADAAPGTTINGTAGDDVICGTSGNDVINGLGGNDTIWGGDGNDTIYGEAGNDKLNGGNGDDVISGGTGNDTEAGGPGADALFGGDGSDALKGDAGNDTLNGEAGNDEILGGAGNDSEKGGLGADRLFGGDGSDALLGEAGDDYLDGGAGKDTGNGGDGVDYCSKDTGEVISSCFNDASPPQLVSVAVSPATIDTSAAAQKVTVRLRIKDLGAGISGYCEPGAKYTDAGVACASWRAYAAFTSGSKQYITGLDSRSCTASGRINPTGNAMCRISGTANDGIYEGAFLVKQYTPRSTFRLTNFFAYDDAGNKDKATALTATFQQTSVGDGVGPVLVSAAFCVPTEGGDCTAGATLDTSAGNQLVKLRAHVTDQGSGLGDPAGRLIFYVGSAPLADAKLGRGQGLQIPAANGGGATLISGTPQDGIYEASYLVPKSFPQTRVYLNGFDADDLAGNNTIWWADTLNSRGLRVSAEQTGAGDQSAPVISNLTLSQNSVNVSSALAWVAVTYRLVDATALFPAHDESYVGYDFSGAGGCFQDAGRNVNLCFGSQNGLLATCPEALAQLDGYACRVSGTPQDGVYKTAVLIPRNARRGAINLSYLMVTDALGNEIYYDLDHSAGANGTAMPGALMKTITVQ